MSVQPPRFSQGIADNLIGGAPTLHEDASRRALHGNPRGVKYPPPQLANIARDPQSHAVYTVQSVVDTIVENWRLTHNVRLKETSMAVTAKANQVKSELEHIVHSPVEENILFKVQAFCEAYGRYFTSNTSLAQDQSDIAARIDRLRLAVDYLRTNNSLHAKATQIQALSKSISRLTDLKVAFSDA